MIFCFHLGVMMTTILTVEWTLTQSQRVSGSTDLVPGSCNILNPSPSLKWNSDSGIARLLSLGDFLEEKKARVVPAMSHTLEMYSRQHWAGRICFLPSVWEALGWLCTCSFSLQGLTALSLWLCSLLRLPLQCLPMPAVLEDQLQSFFFKGKEQGRQRDVEKTPDIDLWPPHVLKVLYTSVCVYICTCIQTIKFKRERQVGSAANSQWFCVAFRHGDIESCFP